MGKLLVFLTKEKSSCINSIGNKKENITDLENIKNM